MDEDDIKRIPPGQIKSDDTAEDLLDSPEMQPYIHLAMEGLKGADVQPQLDALRDLPLETALYLARGIGTEMGLRGF